MAVATAEFQIVRMPRVWHTRYRMALNAENIPTIARLARLRVEPHKYDTVAAGLNRVLAFIEQLSAVDTEGVEPLASVSSVTLPLRDDVANDGGYAAAITANAPEQAHHFFVVPKVVE